MSSLETRVADKIAESLRKARGGRGEPEPVEEELSTVVVKSDFESEFKDKVKGVTFSKVFGIKPPKGMPDLKAPIYKDEDWDEEDRMFIPDKAKFVNYVPYIPTLYKLWVSVLRSNSKGLIVGPTGSGKTSIQEYFCAMIRQPYLRFSGRQDMESDSILGRPWVHGGEMHFELGEMPKAAAKGWYISFDEPWKTPAGIQMTLQRFYEKDGVFQIDDMPGDLSAKVIVPDPRCRLVLSDNVVGSGDNMDQFAATMIQDGSTLNRIDVVMQQPYMRESDEVKMLKKDTPELSDHTAKNMVKFFTLCRTSYDQRALSAALSPRNLLKWAEKAFELGSITTAAQWVILDRFSEDSERSLVREHFRTVFDENL